MSTAEQPPTPTTVTLDAAGVRVLAHPMRSRLLATLRADGPATATRLADRLGTNSGTTSYHLRKLASVGLVTEDRQSGDARDRWWRAAHEMTDYEPTAFADDPDAAAAAGWLLAHHVHGATERTHAWLDAAGQWSADWQRASDLSDYRLYLTADQMTALTEDLHAVVQRYHALGASGDGPVADPTTVPTPDRGQVVPVAVIMHVHPDVYR